MTEKTNITIFVERYFQATQSNNAATWAACFAPEAT
jgi:steroid Delta-isomerase